MQTIICNTGHNFIKIHLFIKKMFLYFSKKQEAEISLKSLLTLGAKSIKIIM